MRFTSSFLLLLAGNLMAQDRLFDTAPLPPVEDRSAAMVAGIDRFISQLTTASAASRPQRWALTDREAQRSRLRHLIGAQDARVSPVTMELVGTLDHPPVIAETEQVLIQRVRWPVHEGTFGEGLLLTPKAAPPLARLIFIPDPSQTPEQLLGIEPGSAARNVFLSSGCQILIPALVNRDTEFSRSATLGRPALVSHREWIYRQSFIMGRHLIGLEVQSIEAAIDWMSDQKDRPTPISVLGFGEGGLIALHTAALDPRLHSALVGGYFGPRETLWQEPIERNVQHLVSEFGDAGVAALIAPRPLIIENAHFPTLPPTPTESSGRSIAAPGQITAFSLEQVEAEAVKARALANLPEPWIHVFPKGDAQAMMPLLFPPDTLAALAGRPRTQPQPLPQSEQAAFAKARQQRLVAQWSAHCQELVGSAERERETTFWKPLPLTDPAAFSKAIEPQRQRFWNEVIGRLPDPNRPPNARSRAVQETDRVTLHEVELDVWEDVTAWAWIALPKDLKPGEKRPVIVCQHGLEGLPEHCYETAPDSRAHAAYKAFALRLAEQGFITVAPHNPYRGGHDFRVLQRKLNPIGLTLFSVIIGQHQRLLEWLKAQPFTAADRIAFYGLSYGGKSAMRIPAVLPDYCLSICSGDFNEWVRKNMRSDMRMSYLFTHEYEIWEWDLAHTFNYAEMAALIAPRPFMVERGHNDGVGVDEWVAYEFAKAFRLYSKLGLAAHCQIEYFDGPHTIHGVGSFDFLRQHLKP
jgi:dienelactone hydrolase